MNALAAPEGRPGANRRVKTCAFVSSSRIWPTTVKRPKAGIAGGSLISGCASRWIADLEASISTGLPFKDRERLFAWEISVPSSRPARWRRRESSIVCGAFTKMNCA